MSLCVLLTATALLLTFMWVTSLLSLLFHLSTPQSVLAQFSTFSVIFEIMNYSVTQEIYRITCGTSIPPAPSLNKFDIRDAVGSLVKPLPDLTSLSLPTAVNLKAVILMEVFILLFTVYICAIKCM